MRCLTLADAMRMRGAQCTFICRPHEGHLLGLIQQRGHKAKALEQADDAYKAPAYPCHAKWLGIDWASDAAQTQQALGDQVVDWLVVDHYALDRRWEQAMRPYTRRILVIDDLADRPHACDLLLDQTFERQTVDYIPLVPEGCTLLCGSKFALLRPEFAALREYSLKRRAHPVLKELLISMGGVDRNNFTGAVLRALMGCSLSEDNRLTVVMGQTAPWLRDVQELSSQMNRTTRVFVGVDNMAQLMADSDLAIGAAGATSWERCCLGLPSISLLTAENQKLIISNLANSGSIIFLEANRLNFELNSIVKFCSNSKNLLKLSTLSSVVTDGQGIERILNSIYG